VRIAICSAVAIMILSVAGCKSMRPSNLTTVGTAHRAWVTLPDRKVVLINGPKVINDTLVGYVEGKYEEIPASDVKQIRVKEWNRGKTALLGILGLAALGGATYAITSSGGYTPPQIDFCMNDPGRPGCQPTQ